MKLISMKISHFRGIHGTNNTIDFSDSNIVFLIGQNNVGKSTYLDAYQFFVDSKKLAIKEDFYNYDVSVPIEISAVFEKESMDETDPELAGTGKSAEPDWINKWVDSNGLVQVRKTWRKTNETFERETWDPSSGKWIPNGFGGLHTKLQAYAPKPIIIGAMETEETLDEKVNKLIQDDYLKRLKSDFPDDFDKILTGISDLQDKIAETDKIKSFNDDLNEHFAKIFTSLTLKIEAKDNENIKIEDAFKKNHSITVEKKGVDRKENFLQYGHGVIRQALFSFLTFLGRVRSSKRKEYIILFEEPELFMHPKLNQLLRERLYSLAENSPFQVMCATHSPQMIDISKPHTSLVRIVKNDAEETASHQVKSALFETTKERRKQIQMINRFNPHVCEAFYANQVLLVEGDTETIVYREILKSHFKTDEVFVLNTGSKNNIPFFQEVLTHFEIEHYAIHDSDTELLEDGAKNPAWSLNQQIWDLVLAANNRRPGLARRYVHKTNFEVAHSIKLTGKDKPMRAYEFISEATDVTKLDCYRWLHDIMTAKEINHDQAYVQK